MKINDVNRVAALQQYRNNRPADKNVMNGMKNKAKDQLEISAEAKEMLTAEKLDGSARAERIEQLKQQVQAGTYHVEAELIAEKMLPYFVKGNR